MMNSGKKEIQKGIEKQEIKFDKQQYWEDIADSNQTMEAGQVDE